VSSIGAAGMLPGGDITANILLMGYTDWIDESFVNTAFENQHCVIVGTPALQEVRDTADSAGGKTGQKAVGRRIRLVRRQDLSDKDALEALLSTYEFEYVFYFSRSVGLFQETSFGELQSMTELMEEMTTHPMTKLVFLCGVNHQHSGGSVEEHTIAQALTDMQRSCIVRGIESMFLAVPWIYTYASNIQEPALQQWIDESIRRGEFSFPFAEEQEIRMISSDDLAELLYRIRDRWIFREDATASSAIGMTLTCKALGDRLKEVLVRTRCRYREDLPVLPLPETDEYIRERFSWFWKHSILEDLPQVLAIKERRGIFRRRKRRSFLEMIDRSAVHPARMALELIIGYAIMESLNRLSNVQVQFKLVDFRLLFVAVAGLMYNIPMGLAAAALASISLILGYRAQGIGWMTLFYEPINWFAFIVYFTMGSVCGYIRSKDQGDLKYAAEESGLLREKYHFLREMFIQSQEEKHEYRQQILNSRDSFGKIFRITQQLDVISPHLVFLQAMSVVEEIMENKTVSIYSIGNNNKGYARLEAASRGMDAPRSFALDSCPEMLDAIRNEGLWVNTELRQDLPMYAAGVIRDDQILLLVMLWRAQFGQMTMYYSNLLKILCGLISTSLLRSLDYQILTHQDRYYADTRFLKPKAFGEELEIAHTMKQSRIANYTLQRLHSGVSAEETAAKLQGKLRENDLLGLIGNNLYLLISQSTPEGIAIVRDRFLKLDIRMEDADFEEVLAEIQDQITSEQEQVK